MLHIDQLKSYSKKPSGKKFAHLIATTQNELHQFATSIGVNKCFYHASPYPHYDISEDHYSKVIAANVLVVSTRQIISIIKGGI